MTKSDDAYKALLARTEALQAAVTELLVDIAFTAPEDMEWKLRLRLSEFAAGVLTIQANEIERRMAIEIEQLRANLRELLAGYAT
jgi:hypothetical protein